MNLERSAVLRADDNGRATPSSSATGASGYLGDRSQPRVSTCDESGEPGRTRERQRRNGGTGKRTSDGMLTTAVVVIVR